MERGIQWERRRGKWMGMERDRVAVGWREWEWDVESGREGWEGL